jgi:hypothetical protein
MPRSVAVGIRHGDTLTIRSDNIRLGYPLDHVRAYVRVR